MANRASIARPYALAEFESAQDSNTLPAWKTFLEDAAALSLQPEVFRLIQNPGATSDQKYGFFEEMLANELNAEHKNFLLLLAQKKRLNVLAEISRRFNIYYATL